MHGAESPPGFLLLPDVLTEAQAATLEPRLEELPFHDFEMHGVTAKRLVIHYGWDYGYESWRLAPAGAPPAFLVELRELAAAAAGQAGSDFEEVLVTRYGPGAGIGWHRDAPLFGEPVLGVSFGAACPMRFRRSPGGRSSTVLLPPQSVYLLAGPARWQWQHSIAPVKTLRYSVTFRKVVQRD